MKIENVKVLNQFLADNYSIYHGDCVEIMKGIPDESIHYSVFSPPFLSLFVYSDSPRDMGNAKTEREFLQHYSYLAVELNRTLIPGRLVSVHCADVPSMKERDGHIGLKEFPEKIIRVMKTAGFIFHSRCIIWKDPLIEATRTKALGLMHKQILKDSSMCRQGIPDQILTFRKKGENPERIEHKEGFTSFIGENEPEEKGVEYSHNVWRRYANPVWCDINQSDTLNVKMARDKRDERHICPLQLGTIQRCLELWSNKGDIVLSPYAGIGSEGYASLRMERFFVGIELKDTYFAEMKRNLQGFKKQRTLV